MDHSVLAFLAGGGVNEWHGTDRIDLSSVVPDFALTVQELFSVLGG